MTRSSFLTTTIALLGAIIAFGVDILTKAIFFNSVDATAGRSIIPYVLRLTQHKNFGLSFNIPIPMFVLLLITAIVFCVVLYGTWRAIEAKQLYATIALALVIGGALGNAYDRWSLGYVRDWILLFDRSAINVADICILVGGVLYLFSRRRPKLSTGQES